jgi:hypothetical protein
MNDPSVFDTGGWSGSRGSPLNPDAEIVAITAAMLGFDFLGGADNRNTHWSVSYVDVGGGALAGD